MRLYYQLTPLECLWYYLQRNLIIRNSRAFSHHIDRASLYRVCGVNITHHVTLCVAGIKLFFAVV